MEDLKFTTLTTDEALIPSLNDAALGPKLDAIIALLTTTITNNAAYHNFWFAQKGSIATEDTQLQILTELQTINSKLGL